MGENPRLGDGFAEGNGKNTLTWSQLQVLDSLLR